jgi:hypothetical protein
MEPSTETSSDIRLFFQKISMQGFYALGLIEIPGAPQTEPQLEVAQTVIDDLMLLREKTEGNLEDGERMTLDKFIADLQHHYLTVRKELTDSGKLKQNAE